MFFRNYTEKIQGFFERVLAKFGWSTLRRWSCVILTFLWYYSIFFGFWIIISDFGTFELARLEPVLVEIALHPFPALIDLFKHQTIQEAGLAGIQRFSKISNFDFITFCNVYAKSDKDIKNLPLKFDHLDLLPNNWPHVTFYDIRN